MQYMVKNTEDQPITSYLQYPSGRLAGMGENLRLLANNNSAYVAPCRPDVARPYVDAVCVPTNKDIYANRTNIRQLMELVSKNEPRLMVILCSGKARKEAAERLAEEFPALTLLAIDGPFLPDSQGFSFETANAPLAYGYTRDTSSKRNAVIRLARIMGWKSILFIDDDIHITVEELWKAADLLEQGASVVAYSVRQYPDYSVVNHASRWAHTPIDCFMGSGAMAVKTDGPLLPFFPNLYNEDWLFMLAYSLYDDGLIWAGTLRQNKYNPFRTAREAQNEEPGDFLAESLMSLTMQLKREKSIPIPFEDGIAKILKAADESFWYKEVITRVIFIRSTMETIANARGNPLTRQRMIRSLKSSLRVLVGQHGDGGIKPEHIINWLHAWRKDMRGWNELNKSTHIASTLIEACHMMNEKMSFIYRQGIPAEDIKHTEHTASGPDSNAHTILDTLRKKGIHPISSKFSLLVPELAKSYYAHPHHMPYYDDAKALFGFLPPRPRSPKAIRGLQTTAVMQRYLFDHGLRLFDISGSAKKLQNNRPTFSPDQPKPRATIVMFVAVGESPEKIYETTENILAWNGKNRTIELVLWVYGRPGSSQSATTAYRKQLIAPILVSVMGSKVRIRSSIIHDASPYRLDEVIDRGLQEIAFAYWKYDIPPSKHPIIVINSHGEPLRHGTLLQFMQSKHWVPNQTLAQYLATLPTDSPDGGKKGAKPAVFNKEADAMALTESYRAILRAKKTQYATTVKQWLRTDPAITLERKMRRMGVSLLELDDWAFRFKLHNTTDASRMGEVHEFLAVVIPYDDNQSETTAQLALDYIDSQARKTQPTAVIIAIACDNSHDPAKTETHRNLIMARVKRYKLPDNYLLGSLVYTDGPEHLKAILCYVHWLENHNCPTPFPNRPKIKLHTLKVQP